MIYHQQPSLVDLAVGAEMYKNNVITLVQNIRRIVVFFMLRANLLLQVGWSDSDVEMDEVSFR